MPQPAFALRRWLLAAAFACPCLAERPASAQQLQVVCTDSVAASKTARACSYEVPRNDAPQLQRIDIRVELSVASDSVTPVPGATVVFRATSGTLIADSVRTDKEGHAYTYWRQSSANESATVSVEATPPVSGSPTAVKIVAVKVPKAEQRILWDEWRTRGAWFEKNPLPAPVSMVVYDVKKEGDREVARFLRDERLCGAQRAVFSTQKNAGTITPDTVPGVMLTLEDSAAASTIVVGNNTIVREAVKKNDRVCFIRAQWRLGEGVGVQSARAQLLPTNDAELTGPTVVGLTARARALPRVIVGPVWTYRSHYTALKQGETRTITVERTDSAGVKETYTRTVTDTSAIEEVDGQGAGALFAGVSFPPVPMATALTMTLGVNAADPLNDWYAGISLLRLGVATIGDGLASEGLPMDAFFLVHWGRPEVLVNEAECRATNTSCETDRRLMWHGLGLMVTVDASTVISEVIKRIGGG